MSAQSSANTSPKVDRDEDKLSPMFRSALDAAIKDNEAGYDAIIYECCRSDELTELYSTAWGFSCSYRTVHLAWVRASGRRN